MESKDLYTCEHYEDVNIMPYVRWQINFNPDPSNHIIKKHTTVIENRSEQLETAFDSKAKECKEEASPNIKVGMEFETMEDVYNFYNRFGRINGMIKKRILVCSEEGERRHDKRDAFVKYRRDETRTGCTSYMRVILGMNGKYRISDFNDNHNHPLASPDKAHMLRSQRKIAIAQAAVAEDCDKSGIRPKSTYDLMSKQAGGRENVGFLPVDYKNYLRTKRMKNMESFDAAGLLGYFRKKQVEDPTFFYSMQLDANDFITSIFWADGRMLIDYELFGDVVCFDTTYKNKFLWLTFCTIYWC